MTPALDHLTLAVPDLGAAVDEIEQMFGVRPALGGRHAAWGTWNALLRLGDSRYLELIARDPVAPRPPGPSILGLDMLATPRLATWVARTSDLEAVHRAAKGQGCDLGAITERSRRREDGSEIRWTMTDPAADREGGVIPFFIDWGSTPHPSSALDPGCELVAMTLIHPDERRVRSLLAALGFDVPVRAGDRPGMTAVIRTPRGDIELR